MAQGPSSKIKRLLLRIVCYLRNNSLDNYVENTTGKASKKPLVNSPKMIASLGDIGPTQKSLFNFVGNILVFREKILPFHSQ
jgi:hypothetical protein